jgi:hypothetical protein
MTDSDRNQTKPTAKQLRYLRDLASSRGESFRYPQTQREASGEIKRLKLRGRTPVAERRRELREVRREVSGLPGDGASIRPEEVEGYGSGATWS